MPETVIATIGKYPPVKQGASVQYHRPIFFSTPPLVAANIYLALNAQARIGRREEEKESKGRSAPVNMCLKTFSLGVIESTAVDNSIGDPCYLSYGQAVQIDTQSEGLGWEVSFER